MVIRFGLGLSRKLLQFATCFKTYKQRSVTIGFLRTVVTFVYFDSYIYIVYYFFYKSKLFRCISVDYGFLVKLFSSTLSFLITFDFFTNCVVFNAGTLVFTTYKFLLVSSLYKASVLCCYMSTYIEVALLICPVFLESSKVSNSKVTNFYLFNRFFITYLSFDEFRFCLVRVRSKFVTLCFAFRFCFKVLPVISRYLTQFVRHQVLQLRFTVNQVELCGVNFLVSTYIDSSLCCSYVSVFTISSHYCLVRIEVASLLSVLNFIKVLHGSVECEFYLEFTLNCLTILYFSTYKGKLVKVIASAGFMLPCLRLCLNLGFCLDFLKLIPDQFFMLGVLNCASKVFMMSCDLYSYLYCLMPILH